MEKTLKRIQGLAKLGRILCIIVFVCSIVCAAGSVLGLISLLAVGETSFVVGGVTIHGMIENSSGLNMPTVYASIVVTFICCLGEIYLAKLAQKYFEFELEEKTPFTIAGAKKLKRLGIHVIVVSLICTVLSSIAIAVVAVISVFPSEDIDVNIQIANGSQIGLGIMFIVIALLLRYMAEKHGDDVPTGIVDVTFSDAGSDENN